MDDYGAYDGALLRAGHSFYGKGVPNEMALSKPTVVWYENLYAVVGWYSG